MTPQNKSLFKLVVGVALMVWAVLALLAHIFFPVPELVVFGIGAMLV